MARGTGKSGIAVGEEHVQRLITVLERYEAKPLPRYGTEVNLSLLARECGFDRKIFQTNPRCIELLDFADQADRNRDLDKLGQAELKREDRDKTDKDRAELESQNLRLMAEIGSLRHELERLRRLESHMAETGKFPF